MLFNMVINSLQALVLYSVPLAVLFDLLKTVWHLPLRKDCLSALFRRCTLEELRDFAKTLPWDHPIARTLDHEVHRRRMAGKSYRCFYRLVWGSFLSSHPFLFLVCRRVSQSRFSSASPVAHPPLPLPSTSKIKLGRAVLGTKLFVSIFFLDSLTTLEDRPVCHIYQWVAHPTYGSVCNHCARMVGGLTLDDMISGNREGSLTEDEVVAYVQSGDPTNQAWDDAFLRANGPVPEPDLAAIGFLHD